MPDNVLETVRLPRDTLERVVSIAAAATFVYSLVAFCFEAGFFWEVGLQYLPVFSIGEHLAHAGASFLVSVLAALSLLFLLLLQAVMRHYLEGRLTTAVDTPDDARPEAPLTRPRKIIVGLLVAPLFLTLAAYLFVTLVPELVRDLTPIAMLGVMAVIAIAAYLLEDLLGSPTRWWLGPAILCGMFAPTALGQFHYHRLVGSAEISSFTLAVGDRTVTGTMVFAGTSKFIMMQEKQWCIADYELKTVLVITPRRSTSGRTPPRGCRLEAGGGGVG